MRGNEAGFVMNGTPNNYSIGDTESGNTQGYQQMSINPRGSANPTFALFHVHPDKSGPYPSTSENNALGRKDRGDTLVSDQKQIPFYVLSSRGLTMYDPKTKKSTMLRKNLDWTKPCK